MPGLIRRISTKISKSKPVSSALDTARSLSHSRSQHFNPSHGHSNSQSSTASYDSPIYDHFTSRTRNNHHPYSQPYNQPYDTAHSPSPSLDAHPFGTSSLIFEESEDDNDDDEVQIQTASAVPMRKVSREGVRVVSRESMRAVHSPVGSPGAAPYGVRETRRTVGTRARTGGKAPRIRITFDDQEEEEEEAWPRWI